MNPRAEDYLFHFALVIMLFIHCYGTFNLTQQTISEYSKMFHLAYYIISAICIIYNPYILLHIQHLNNLLHIEILKCFC